MEVCDSDINCGVGLFKLNAAVPDMNGSEDSAALTVTVLGVGGKVGAVYTPAAEIVPTAAEPPMTPLTDQVTLGEVPSFAFAVKVWEPAPRTAILAGLTVNADCCDPSVPFVV